MAKQNRPTIGVCIPTYNQVRYIRDCVESVINQTYPPSQIVICDDASTDGTREIVREYERNYPGLVEAIYQPRNVGVAANINAGHRLVSQDYISSIASDDIWHPDKLRLEIERLQSAPEARWVYSGVARINEAGERFQALIKEDTGREGNLLFSVLAHRISVRNYLAELSLNREVGFVDEQLALGEDWDYKIRLSAIAPIVWVPETTVYYRRHEESLSRTSKREIYIDSLISMYKKHEALIAGLTRPQRAKVNENRRAVMKSHLLRGAKEELYGKPSFQKRLKALKFWLKALAYTRRANTRLLAHIVLPYKAVSFLRSMKS